MSGGSTDISSQQLQGVHRLTLLNKHNPAVKQGAVQDEGSTRQNSTMRGSTGRDSKLGFEAAEVPAAGGRRPLWQQ